MCVIFSIIYARIWKGRKIMKFYRGPLDEYTLFRYKLHLTERENNNAMKVGIHIHRSAEILLVTKGYIDITVSGREKERISAGEGAFLFPYQPHEYERPDGTDYFRFNFSSALTSGYFIKNQGKVGKGTRFKADLESIAPILKRLYTGEIPDELKLKGFIYSLLSDFSRQVELVTQSADDSILSRAIIYLNDKGCEGATISSVAKAIGCCDKYLSRALNSIAGVSFSSLLSTIRIDKAIALLTGTDKTMLEISEQCGFGSERSFYRQFLATTGQTPRSFRKTSRFYGEVDPISE